MTKYCTIRKIKKAEKATYFTIKTMQYIPPNSWPEIFLLHKIQNPKNIVLPANISNKKKK